MPNPGAEGDFMLAPLYPAYVFWKGALSHSKSALSQSGTICQ